MGPILVTGGTGTLGRVVVQRLTGQGRQVRVLSRRLSAGRWPAATWRPAGATAWCCRSAAFAGYRRGDHLAPEHAVGRVTFADFLAGRFGGPADRRPGRSPV